MMALTRICVLLASTLVLAACSSSTDPGTPGLTTNDVQGVWDGSTENFTRIVIKGTTIRGGDTQDHCFAEAFSGTISTTTGGGLKVTVTAGGSGTGTISLQNGKLVVTGVSTLLINDFNQTYNKQNGDPNTNMADC